MAKAANASLESGGGCPSGFTLLEALVVLALLSVLLGLTAPALTGLRERQRLQARAEAFWNSLMLARAQAVLHQQHVTVCTASKGACDPVADWHAGWLVFLDPNRNGQRDADERVIEQVDAPQGALRITGNATVNRIIGYGAEGRSESLTGAFQAGTVSVCTFGQSQAWQVAINAVGRPRLQKTETASCP